MRSGGLVFLALAMGCSTSRAEPKPPKRSTTTPHATVTRVEQNDGLRVVEFTGACDASGAVPIDARLFALADDEDNVLRIYDADRGGAPVSATDVSPMLQLTKKKKDKWPESDLEAATRVGDRALWLSSHARSKKGKLKPDRFRFFATDVPGANRATALRGSPYGDLLRDLLTEPALQPFGLAEAADKPPQAEGGLNIEGMTAMPDGAVLLGFRNPVPNGRALLVPMTNPLAPFAGKALLFGAPIDLNLGGLGVRALSYWHGKYVIAAGHYGDGGARRLYAWSGPGAHPQLLPDALPRDINPEAFFTPEERDELLVLSDDGTRAVDGLPCKELDDDRQKRFRGVWLQSIDP
jgi:hypothetical protein